MSKQDNKSYLMLPESTIQRILHLKLQGFSVQQISQMQKVTQLEIKKLFNEQQQDVNYIGDAPFKTSNSIKQNKKVCQKQ
jgi:hypothetical protein